MTLQKSLINLLAGVLLCQAQVSAPIKWACIGNSITAGSGASAGNSYPSQLANKLGPAFQVQNDGVSSTTLLKKGDFPYWTHGLFSNVFAFKPDLVTIALGTNDTKPQNAVYIASDFVNDLTAMIDTVAAISSHPQIWLCLPCPIFPNTYGITDSVLGNQIIPLIKKVAAAKGLNVIDVNSALSSHANLFPDGVHPNDEGADSVASVIYQTFMSKVTRVSCIGNSITQGQGVAANVAYPIQLNMLLGRGFIVENDGVSGDCMMKNGGLPYWTKGRLPQVFAFKPNLITILLGTNDSRIGNWNTAGYETDYRAFIDTVSGIASKPRVLLGLPLPVWQVNAAWPYSGLDGDIIRDSMLPAIRQVATQKGASILDANTAFQTMQAHQPDGVHPDTVGQDTLSEIFYRALKAAAVSIQPKIKTMIHDVDHAYMSLGGSRSDRESGMYSLDGKNLPTAGSKATAPEIHLMKIESVAK